jgi:hypothetical protein
MVEKKTSMLYDRDFFEWASRNAQLLREGRVTEVDAEHLAEEIEGMGKSERRAVFSHLRVFMVLLLKRKIQPAKRSLSWRATMREQRRQLELLFADSPSLENAALSNLEGIYRDAVEDAREEMGIAADLPEECIWRLPQILDKDFLPD